MPAVGVAMMITGGISPNREGWLIPLGGTLNQKADVFNHRRLTKAAHQHGSKLLCKICTVGAMATTRLGSASPVKSIFKPREMSEKISRAPLRTFCAYRQTGQIGGL